MKLPSWLEIDLGFINEVHPVEMPEGKLDLDKCKFYASDDQEHWDEITKEEFLKAMGLQEV